MKYRLTSYISVPQAAELLGLKANTFRTLLDNGTIGYMQPGKHKRVLVKDVIDYRERVTRPACHDDEKIEEVLHH